MDIRRQTSDNHPMYLVNDDSLDVDKLRESRVIIVGERHRCKDDEDLVEKLIRELKPDYVLCEALCDYVLMGKVEKVEHNSLDPESHYYQWLTLHWLDISLRHAVPFIGMEYVNWKGNEHGELGLKNTFAIREKHFIEVINRYEGKKLIVVCGDTHLRTIDTDQLGVSSPLYLKLKDGTKPTVVRSRIGEIE